MNRKKEKSWLLASPERKYKFKHLSVNETTLSDLIKESVLDTIRPYGSSVHRQDQYKKIEK